MKLKYAVLFLLVILVAGLTKNVQACACCAEPGQWSVDQMDVADVRDAILSRLNLSGKMGNVNNEPVIPIEATSISGKFTGNEVVLTVVRPHGKPVILRFSLDDKFEKFLSDDGQKAEGGDPLLYKEIRLRGKLSSEDKTVIPAVPVGAQLILQGRGNVCSSWSDFRHWVFLFTVQKGDESDNMKAYGPIN